MQDTIIPSRNISGKHQVVQSSDVLEHQGVVLSSSTELVSAYSPYLHFADAMLDRDTYRRKTVVVGLLPVGKLSSLWFLVGNLEYGAEVARIAHPGNTGG